MNEHGNIVIYKDKYGHDNIEVTIKDDSVWLNQEQLVKLYNSSKSDISEHIKHIFEENELDENVVVRKFRTTANDGKNYNVNYYNLDMIVAIGFRVRSNIGTNFRKWANGIVKEYTIQGWVLDDERLKNGGSVLTKEYFDKLLERIREIRLSERKFYQKVTDIYATAIDYDKNCKTTYDFFKKVQNKCIMQFMAIQLLN